MVETRQLNVTDSVSLQTPLPPPQNKTLSLWNCIGDGYLGNVGEITTQGRTANLCNINSIGKVQEVTF